MTDALQIIETEDGSRTLFDPRLGVHYHSVFGAIAESRHVFLNASGLAERLAAQKSVSILEIGLGTGLNFCLSAQLAFGFPESRLNYTAYEPFPPPPEILADFYRHQPFDSSLIAPLIECSSSGVLNNIHYTFHYQAFTPELALPTAFDLVFYDAFSPKDAPEMWTEPMIEAALKSLKPNGLLLTYSVTGDMKRILRKLDYRFERPKGFGAKWQMLICYGR